MKSFNYANFLRINFWYHRQKGGNEGAHNKNYGKGACYNDMYISMKYCQQQVNKRYYIRSKSFQYEKTYYP